MKYIIIALVAVIALLVGVGVSEASKLFLKADQIAEVGISSEKVTVFKMVDGTTVCYITRGGKTVYHAISCVK